MCSSKCIFFNNLYFKFSVFFPFLSGLEDEKAGNSIKKKQPNKIKTDPYLRESWTIEISLKHGV